MSEVLKNGERVGVYIFSQKRGGSVKMVGENKKGWTSFSYRRLLYNFVNLGEGEQQIP